MKTMPAVFGVIFVLATAAGMGSQTVAVRGFYKEVAQRNLAQIQLGTLAAEKSQSPAVRAYAEQMVEDHTVAYQQLALSAERDGIKLPTQPTAAQRATHARLEALNGAAFDGNYLDVQLEDHGSMVRLLKSHVDIASDPATLSYSDDALPIAKQHEDMAKRMVNAEPSPSHVSARVIKMERTL